MIRYKLAISGAFSHSNVENNHEECIIFNLHKNKCITKIMWNLHLYFTCNHIYIYTLIIIINSYYYVLILSSSSSSWITIVMFLMIMHINKSINKQIHIYIYKCTLGASMSRILQGPRGHVAVSTELLGGPFQCQAVLAHGTFNDPPFIPAGSKGLQRTYTKIIKTADACQTNHITNIHN